MRQTIEPRKRLGDLRVENSDSKVYMRLLRVVIVGGKFTGYEIYLLNFY